MKTKKSSNPCKECIVTTMCEESCEKFKQYVVETTYLGGVSHDLIPHLCNRIRERMCELYNNDEEWRWSF